MSNLKKKTCLFKRVEVAEYLVYDCGVSDNYRTVTNISVDDEMTYIKSQVLTDWKNVVKSVRYKITFTHQDNLKTVYDIKSEDGVNYFFKVNEGVEECFVFDGNDFVKHIPVEDNPNEIKENNETNTSTTLKDIVLSQSVYKEDDLAKFTSIMKNIMSELEKHNYTPIFNNNNKIIGFEALVCKDNILDAKYCHLFRHWVKENYDYITDIEVWPLWEVSSSEAMGLNVRVTWEE